MEVLATIKTGRHTLEFGVAATGEEGEAVLAQRFRVYQREGYYREGVSEDRDDYDRDAVYFFGRLRRAGAGKSPIVGSARLILGRDDPGFLFPCQRAHQFDLPPAVQEIPAAQRAEVGRLVAEKPASLPIGRLAITLGLMRALAEYARTHDLRCGLATIKLRLLKSAGLPLHEILFDGVIYPKDGIVAGYFHRHPDPAVPIYWLADETVRSLRRAVALWQRTLASAGTQRAAGKRRSSQSFDKFPSGRFRPVRRALRVRSRRSSQHRSAGVESNVISLPRARHRLPRRNR